MLNLGKRELLVMRRRVSLKSQAEVAIELGISQAQYSMYERGYRVPSDDNAEKLVKMFDLPPDYFKILQTEQEGA